MKSWEQTSLLLSVEKTKRETCSLGPELVSQDENPKSWPGSRNISQKLRKTKSTLSRFED